MSTDVPQPRPPRVPTRPSYLRRVVVACTALTLVAGVGVWLRAYFSGSLGPHGLSREGSSGIGPSEPSAGPAGTAPQPSRTRRLGDGKPPFRVEFTGLPDRTDQLAAVDEAGHPLFDARVFLTPASVLFPQPGGLASESLFAAMQPWLAAGRYVAIRLVVAGPVDDGSTVRPSAWAGVPAHRIPGRSGETEVFEFWGNEYLEMHRQMAISLERLIEGLTPEQHSAILWFQIPLGYQGESTVVKNDLDPNKPDQTAAFGRRLQALEALGYTDRRWYDQMLNIAAVWQPLLQKFKIPMVFALNPRGMALRQMLENSSTLSVGTVAGKLRRMGFHIQYDGAGRGIRLPAEFYEAYQPPSGGLIMEEYAAPGWKRAALPQVDLAEDIAEMQRYGAQAGLFYPGAARFPSVLTTLGVAATPARVIGRKVARVLAEAVSLD